MNNTTMALQNSEWTRMEIAICWADDESLTAEQIEDCADSELAFIINNLPSYLPGWSYDGRSGTFTGTFRRNGVDVMGQIMQIICDAVDHVVEHLDEIKAEAA